jgi:hypothetical protein
MRRVIRPVAAFCRPLASAAALAAVLLSLADPATAGRLGGALQADPAEEPEGATLDVVQVPLGSGDGRVTERDAKAFSAWCVWGFEELAASEGVEIELGPDGEQRMLDFWVWAWGWVDPGTKVIVSQADQLWPQVQQAAAADAGTKAALVEEFGVFAAETWGLELIGPTIEYLGGVMDPAQYSGLIEQAVARAQAAPGGPRYSADGTVMPSWEDPSITDGSYEGAPNGGQDYMMNDGSGDIMYVDPN